jgi:hypothetical protein
MGLDFSPDLLLDFRVVKFILWVLDNVIRSLFHNLARSFICIMRHIFQISFNFIFWRGNIVIMKISIEFLERIYFFHGSFCLIVNI